MNADPVAMDIHPGIVPEEAGGPSAPSSLSLKVFAWGGSSSHHGSKRPEDDDDDDLLKKPLSMAAETSASVDKPEEQPQYYDWTNHLTAKEDDNKPYNWTEHRRRREASMDVSMPVLGQKERLEELTNTTGSLDGSGTGTSDDDDEESEASTINDEDDDDYNEDFDVELDEADEFVEEEEEEKEKDEEEEDDEDDEEEEEEEGKRQISSNRGSTHQRSRHNNMRPNARRNVPPRTRSRSLTKLDCHDRKKGGGISKPSALSRRAKTTGGATAQVAKPTRMAKRAVSTSAAATATATNGGDASLSGGSNNSSHGRRRRSPTRRNLSQRAHSRSPENSKRGARATSGRRSPSLRGSKRNDHQQPISMSLHGDRTTGRKQQQQSLQAASVHGVRGERRQRSPSKRGQRQQQQRGGGRRSPSLRGSSHRRSNNTRMSPASSPNNSPPTRASNRQRKIGNKKRWGSRQQQKACTPRGGRHRRGLDNDKTRRLFGKLPSLTSMSGRDDDEESDSDSDCSCDSDEAASAFDNMVSDDNNNNNEDRDDDTGGSKKGSKGHGGIANAFMNLLDFSAGDHLGSSRQLGEEESTSTTTNSNSSGIKGWSLHAPTFHTPKAFQLTKSSSSRSIMNSPLFSMSSSRSLAVDKEEEQDDEEEDDLDISARSAPPTSKSIAASLANSSHSRTSMGARVRRSLKMTLPFAGSVPDDHMQRASIHQKKKKNKKQRKKDDSFSRLPEVERCRDLYDE